MSSKPVNIIEFGKTYHVTNHLTGSHRFWNEDKTQESQFINPFKYDTFGEKIAKLFDGSPLKVLEAENLRNSNFGHNIADSFLFEHVSSRTRFWMTGMCLAFWEIEDKKYICH